ncbi:MAG: nucleoside triphosphate pyrophosphohydrolase [Oscillospiraceae bacterium]|nr:nucleoside triphosphate pyrophosphohydrolase [Oscillospiraceae bacterium]
MVNFQCKDAYTVEDLRRIIALLRSEDGCPWDREQTHESIRRNFIEETYEACEAIDAKDSDLLCEELGDVLTQVIFHAEIEEEAGRFDLNDVADVTCKKLIFRHPHIFGDAQASDAAQVLLNWDELKRREKCHETTTQAMEAVARSLPATWRAEKIQDKARKVGFDWPDAPPAVDKLEEELTELKAAITGGTGIREELGDLLFSVINVARLLEIDPEAALHEASDKFIRRFAYLEQAAADRGQVLSSMPLDEMEALYQEGKARL